jgi:hypothetical protein
MSNSEFGLPLPEVEGEGAPLASIEPDPESKGSSWSLWLVGSAAVGAIFLSCTLVPNFLKARTRGQLTACKSNCKNLATALEMYASDNSGYYPDRLEVLTTGNYLKMIPTCPAAGRMTYTNYEVSHKPQLFSFACCGNNHKRGYAGFAGSSENYPRYHAEKGLIDHP